MGFKIFMVIFYVLFVAFIGYQIISGKIAGIVTSSVRRDKNPILFWIVAAIATFLMGMFSLEMYYTFFY